MQFVAPIALFDPITNWFADHVTKQDRALAIAITAAVITGLVAIYNRRREHNRLDRERRREMYANAYRDCMTWEEMFYRVRRREEDGSIDRVLIDKFHDLQEALAFHEGWINSESHAMGIAFASFKKDVKFACEASVVAAWSEPGLAHGAQLPKEPSWPDISECACEFQEATRLHLSKWPWHRIQPWWKYGRPDWLRSKKEAVKPEEKKAE